MSLVRSLIRAYFARVLGPECVDGRLAVLVVERLAAQDA